MSFFLFPGQGSQAPGMGKDFYEGSEAARAVLEEARDILGADWLTTVFEGSAEALTDTRVAQVSLVAVGTAIARHLTAHGVTAVGAAGHSVGEIAALVTARALEFADGLRITRERARLMAEESPEGTMAAVLGLASERIAEVLPDGAEIANYNGPDQTIISGVTTAVDEACETLMGAGAKRVLPLRVSGPFHSSCMRRAAEKFQIFLNDFSLQAPEIRFISSVTGHEESAPDRIRELLWQQLYSPVRWTDVMESVGPVNAIEVGPGSVLSGIAKRTPGAPKVEAAGTLARTGAIIESFTTTEA